MSKQDTDIAAIELEEKGLAAETAKRLAMCEGDVHTIVKMTQKQTEYYEAGEKCYDEILFSGGAGSGKSTALILKMLHYLSCPNTTVVLLRQSYTDLQRSTLRLLRYGEVDNAGRWREPFLFPSEIESFDRTNGILQLTNGSTIIAMGVSDGSKIKSINCAAFFVEEATQISRENYIEASIRPRMPHPLGNKIYAVSNPSHKGHWLYKHFVSERVATRKMICVSSDSNPYLVGGYTDRLNNLDDETKKRMLKGEWSDQASAVFTRFEKSRNVQACKHLMSPDYCSEIVVGQDIGGGSQFAGFVIAGKATGGKIHIFCEWNKKAITTREALTWMETYRGVTNATCVFDSSNQITKSDMEDAGWTCIPSIKNIEASVDLCNDLFASESLVIDPSCEILLREIEEAHRNEETGRINKTKAWDVIDAMRYAVWHLSDLARETNKNAINYFMVF